MAQPGASVSLHRETLSISCQVGQGILGERKGQAGKGCLRRTGKGHKYWSLWSRHMGSLPWGTVFPGY